MPTAPLGPDHPRWGDVLTAASLRRDHATITEISAQMGVPRGTVDHWLRVFDARGLDTADMDAGKAKLESLGYDLDAEEMTPEEAWNRGRDAFERTASETLRRQWRAIERGAGPFVIFHQTDVHVDDNGTPLRLIEDDITAARGMGAIMVHGGDLVNNWPETGRLARQWASQECSRPTALLRAQHYIGLLDPDVWVDGNHEEMTPYLTDLIKGWLPEKTLTDYWTINFVVRTPGGRPVRCVVSHRFGRGQTWFHRLQGHIRTMLEGQEADLYLDGHLHSAGVMEHHLPERGLAATLVASGGYKMVDDYARRISKDSGQLRINGRCHFIVCDPQAERDESLCTAFRSARQAEGYLNGLANLRAV